MMITSATTGVSSQSWDYVNNYTDVQAWIPKNMVIVNKRAFKRLDKSLQKALLIAASAAEIRGWEMAKNETAIKNKQLMEHGMNVVEPTKKLTKALKIIGDNMAKEWAEEAGPEGKHLLKEFHSTQH